MSSDHAYTLTDQKLPLECISCCVLAVREENSSATFDQSLADQPPYGGGGRNSFSSCNPKEPETQQGNQGVGLAYRRARTGWIHTGNTFFVEEKAADFLMRAASQKATTGGRKPHSGGGPFR